MPWKHLIALNLLALHALLIVLNYFGILTPLVAHLGGDTNLWMPQTWVWLHAPAIGINAWILEQSGAELSRQGAGLLFMFCLAAQDLFVGYVFGSVMDLPWNRWLGFEKEEEEEEDKEHRDLRIAMRAMEKVEQAEKERKREKVERLKREAKEKADGGETSAAA